MGPLDNPYNPWKQHIFLLKHKIALFDIGAATVFFIKHQKNLGSHLWPFNEA